MPTVKTLQEIQSFLQETVCNDFKLKRPNDKNVDEFELVKPNSFVMNFPPKNYLPNNIKSIIPCIVVTFEEGTDDSKTSEMSIRLIVVVYSPGFHSKNEDSVEASPDGNGWIDLLNFMDKIKAQILRNQVLNGNAVQYPLKWGVYQREEQTPETDPYFYGWITFGIKKQAYPTSEINKLLE